MKLLVKRILSMPFVMRMVCLVMFLSPIIVLVSTLSGTVLCSLVPDLRYGAADDLLELVLVIVVVLPACVGSVLMILKKWFSVHLFALGYVGGTIGPFVLEAAREQFSCVVTSAAGALVVGGGIYAYLLLSANVREYFSPR